MMCRTVRVTLWFLVVVAKVQGIPPEQVAALETIYAALQGSTWARNDNWLTGDPCTPGANWYGLLDANGTPCTGNIALIGLQENGLQGSIPDVFEVFQDTKSVLFGNDRIQGQIPKSLFLMKSLEVLELNDLRLSGTIPATLGFATSLQFFRLFNDGITSLYSTVRGTIPSGIGNLKNLQRLELGNLKLQGEYPSEEMMLLTEMETFMSYSVFVDLQFPLPSFPCAWKKLRTLVFSYDPYNSSIPSCFGELSELESLRVHSTSVSGTLPTTLGKLQKLQQLEFSYSKINGIIPEEYGRLTSLTALELEVNMLGGTVPSELGQLSDMQYLSLAGNSFEGDVPPEWVNMTSMLQFSIGSNKLTGTIPDIICNWPVLQNYLVGNNEFYGTLPPCLSSLSNIRKINVENNSVVGTVPNLEDLSLLEYLVLSRNTLTGSLPLLPKSVESVSLENNSFSGSIPEQWWMEKHPRLFFVVLDSNSLSGTIPREFIDRSSNAMDSFFVEGNEMSGVVPPEICPLNFGIMGNLFACPLPECCRFPETCNVFTPHPRCCSDECMMFAEDVANEEETRSVAIGLLSSGVSLLACLSAVGLVAAIVRTTCRSRELGAEREALPFPAARRQTSESGYSESGTDGEAPSCSSSENGQFRRELRLRMKKFGDLLQGADHLVLKDIIGSGASSQVWKASFRGEPVAAKQFQIRDPAAMQRFHMEAYFLASIRHPNIVQMFGLCVSVEDGLGWIIMECLPLSLEDMLHKSNDNAFESFQLVDRCVFLLDVTRAVTHLHSLTPPIIHRDIKPGNALLSLLDITVKLCDFASAMQGDIGEGVNGTVGTPSFIAPEVLASAPCTTESDVYSLAGLWYEVLTGRRLSSGNPYEAMVRTMESREGTLNTDGLPEVLTTTVEAAFGAAAGRPTSSKMLDVLERFYRTISSGVHSSSFTSGSDGTRGTRKRIRSVLTQSSLASVWAQLGGSSMEVEREQGILANPGDRPRVQNFVQTSSGSTVFNSYLSDTM